MAKKNQTKREPAELPEKIRYEDTKSFEVTNRMMRTNMGVWLK